MKHLFLPLLWVLSMLLFGCSKDKDSLDAGSSTTTIKGVVEKGPFVRGTSLHIYELDDKLNPTGRSFKTEIIDDLGNFSLAGVDLKSKYVQLSVQNGYYFNELTGRLSSSTITLNTLAEVDANKAININILGHLEEKRVKHLFSKQGLSMDKAKAQAQKELYEAFFVESSPNVLAENISLMKDAKNGAILLAISAAMLEGADSDNAKLTELLNKISLDLAEDGILEADLSALVELSIENLSPTRIIENVKERYKELGVEVPDFDLDDIFTVEFNFLDIEPEDIISEDVYWNDKNSFIIAFNAFRTKIIDNLGQYFLLEGLYTNTIAVQDEYSLLELYHQDVRPSNNQIFYLFRDVYEAIAYANSLMAAVDKTKEIDVEIYRHKTYPYFVLQYWMLANFWGDVFYMNPDNFNNHQTESLFPSRSKKKDVLIDLFDKLEVSVVELERANDDDVYLGKLMLGRLALELGNVDKAQIHLKSLLDDGRYSLSAKTVLHNSSEESLFGLEYSNLFFNSPPPFTRYLTSKGSYFHMTRYTEVVLLASETYLKKGNKKEAARLLNLVRERNGKKSVDSGSDLLNYLEEEYREDMSAEGVYFAFLKRNNKAESVLNIPSYRQLLPLPQYELDLNKNAKQNPGY